MEPDPTPFPLDWLAKCGVRGSPALTVGKVTLSHAELDEASELDIGNPQELGELYAELKRRLPWLNVFGGCCGSDLRHVTSIARSIGGTKPLTTVA